MVNQEEKSSLEDNLRKIVKQNPFVLIFFFNIKESEKTNPVLAYSSSKAINEEQLKKSGKNYVILRLGSVYGYSTDSMRVDIMPNLFSKISSQNGTLKLFAGGRHIKSLVPLIDVARCFKFMEERDDLNYELFNFTKET